jgi:hypothetical protein
MLISKGKEIARKDLKESTHYENTYFVVGIPGGIAARVAACLSAANKQ